MKIFSAFILLFLCTVANATTYYIDHDGGSDSNNGLTKLLAWQNHPYMLSWGGSYSHSAGDKFIFKGGVTWTSNCFGALGMQVPSGGSAGNNDYYGVDVTWFSGGSFTRPKFDGQNKSGYILHFAESSKYVTVDSLELCHIARRTAGAAGDIIAASFAQFMVFTNCYLHGWMPFAGDGLGQDDLGGGFFGNYSSGVGPDGMYLTGCEIENSENGPAGNWNGFAVNQAGIITNCLIHDNGGLITGTIEVRNSRIWDSGYPYTNIDTDFHIDTCYLSNPSGQAYGTASNCYCVGNQVWNCGGENAGLVYADCAGVDCYVYNNLLYGHVNSSPIYVDTIGESFATTPAHSFYCYNNTAIGSGTVFPLLHMRTAHIGNDPGNPPIQWQNFFVTNNFFAGGPQIPDADPATWAVNPGVGKNISFNNVVLANAYGYSITNLYAPVSGTVPTVGAGANLTSLALFTKDILFVSRPSSGAWDVGAYEYNGGGPFPPSHVTIKSVVAGANPPIHIHAKPTGTPGAIAIHSIP